MLNISSSMQDKIHTLKLSGRFDFHVRKSFQTAIEQARAAESRRIILNFVDVPFIDSAGLGLLMLAKKNLVDSQCELTLAIPPGYVMEVMNLANMGKMFPIISVVETGKVA